MWSAGCRAMGDRVRLGWLVGRGWLLLVVAVALAVFGCTPGSTEAESDLSTAASGPNEGTDEPIDGREPDGPPPQELPDREESGRGEDLDGGRGSLGDRARSERVLRECQQSVVAPLGVLRGQLQGAADVASPLRPSLVMETQGALRRCVQRLSSDAVDGVGPAGRERAVLQERSRELVMALDQLREADGLEQSRFEVARRTVLDLTVRWEQSLQRNLQHHTNR